MTENPKNTKITRVMIIDDHEIVRRGIAEIIDRDDALEVVADAGSVADGHRYSEAACGFASGDPADRAYLVR